MPEGVRPYPKWQGTLATATRVPAVAAQEVRRALRGNWALLAFLLGLVWGAASIAELIQLRRDEAIAHDLDVYLAMLRQLRWFAVALAAAVGGPAILDDLRSGALELYLSRPLSRLGYVAGKAGAVLGLVAAVTVLPAVLYYLASLVFFRDHPDGWHALQGAGILSGFVWAALVAGLALGLSCTMRSSRAAAILLFAGFVGLHIFAKALLAPITEDLRWRVLSPFYAMRAFESVLFRTDYDPGFPTWWGVVAVLGLTVLGWSLVAARPPRARGEAA